MRTPTAMVDLRKVDVRTVQRYIAKGVVTQEQYDKLLADLPDAAEEAEFVDYAEQFEKEEAERRAEQVQPETPSAPPVVEPAPAVATAFVPPAHHAPPATVAPASVAPSAVASVPQPTSLPRPGNGEGSGG